LPSLKNWGGADRKYLLSIVSDALPGATKIQAVSGPNSLNPEAIVKHFSFVLLSISEMERSAQL